MKNNQAYYDKVATAFTAARKNDEAISNYPERVPADLTEAYAIQDKAIELWPHKIMGWKVGGIGGEMAITLGTKKLSGPIYENQIFHNKGEVIKMQVFEKGFAAIEGEIVLVMNADAPEGKTEWTTEEAKAMVGAAYIGVEIASSPFPEINNLGPLVTISDFGNNNGLILGDLLPHWESFPTQDWVVETIIDGKSFGVKSSADAGGPLESLRFCLGNTAQRGMPMKKGMMISTGAITGVHQAFVGQKSTVSCKGAKNIDLELVAY